MTVVTGFTVCVAKHEIFIEEETSQIFFKRKLEKVNKKVYMTPLMHQLNQKLLQEVLHTELPVYDDLIM